MIKLHLKISLEAGFLGEIWTSLALSGLQSRFGDNLLRILSGSFPKRDCRPSLKVKRGASENQAKPLPPYVACVCHPHILLFARQRRANVLLLLPLLLLLLLLSVYYQYCYPLLFLFTTKCVACLAQPSCRNKSSKIHPMGVLYTRSIYAHARY